jgi:hypothetical protein
MPARYRNRGTNSRACVPDLTTLIGQETASALIAVSYDSCCFLNTARFSTRKTVKTVNNLTILVGEAPTV